MLKKHIAMLLLVGLIACTPNSGSKSKPPENGLKVVATTSIVADLVRNVGGDLVEVKALMGPGIDPHLYTPSAGDVRRMAEAEMIFFNGLHLEGKMAEVLTEMNRQSVATVAVAECVDSGALLQTEESQGIVDPHVWFDVHLWQEAARCVQRSLIERDGEHSAEYSLRADAYVAELEALDERVREMVSDLDPADRILITAHDAFAYFGRAYGFEVRGLLGVSTASEAGTADVQQLADFIVERKVPAIFIESSVSPRYVEALREAVAARSIDVKIGGSLYSDALGDVGSPAESYIGTVQANVETIVGALSGL
ncbi:MAG: zinc ABC transporter solute-binding protein [bacterium]|nr:zinc ABC transporter solute-binding protein [bacterium]